MSYKVEKASNDINLFGESPLWDNRRQQLVFTDAFAKSVSVFDPLSKSILKKRVELPQNEEFLYTGVCMPYSSTTNKFLITLSSGKLVQFD
jgi:sugar lactone lactonase YvrE